MNNYFRPTGNMVRLVDGRVFKKNDKNLWEDVNSGIKINDIQLQNFITSAAFSADPSGGNSRRVSAPDAVVSLSAPFDDIVIASPAQEAFNVNRTLSITGGPVTLTITLSSDGTYESSALDAYKNDVVIRNIRLNSGSAGLVVTLPETFADGDQLKFRYSLSTMNLMNFNVTIEKTAPGATSVLDVFNCSTVP